ncbi:glucosaminidase domain-containing protein [bacterium]|nr:glucosaminidase domain-containing protein [bacterium]
MKQILIVVFFLSFLSSFSQPAERRLSRSQYIEKYKDDAIREMHRSGVPASITLSQGILESGDGNSPLAMYGNNHFGIKCHAGWKGKTMRIDDDKRDECFRKYNDVYESFKDHSEFLSTRGRYSSLFELKITDYKAWAKGLKKAGYATNPQYANLLIKIIEDHDLHKFDSYGKMPPKKPSKNKVTKTLATIKQVKSIKLHNNIKYVIAKNGDSFSSIASDFEMNLWQIHRYNDLNREDHLKEGDLIYLQPKRNKAKEEYHTLKKGENMRDVSQLHGIKLKKLYKKNNLISGTVPPVGTKLHLRKRKATNP